MSGIVVEHKESGVVFAISEEHFNPALHKKVRDLHPYETVRAFAPYQAPQHEPKDQPKETK